MKVQENKFNKSWNKEITQEEIFNEEFSIGYLIQSNQHLKLFQDLKDKVLSEYLVKATFNYLGYNGQSIWANNQKLIYRLNKFKDFKIGKYVKYLDGNLNHKGGGSNAYPSVAFKGAYCTLEFISYGLPFVNKINGWSIKIININKIS